MYFCIQTSSTAQRCSFRWCSQDSVPFYLQICSWSFNTQLNKNRGLSQKFWWRWACWEVCHLYILPCSRSFFGCSMSTMQQIAFPQVSYWVFCQHSGIKVSLESQGKTVVLTRERESRMYIPSGLWIWAVFEQWWYICTYSVIWKWLLNEEFYNKCLCLVQWPFSR